MIDSIQRAQFTPLAAISTQHHTGDAEYQRRVQSVTPGCWRMVASRPAGGRAPVSNQHSVRGILIGAAMARQRRRRPVSLSQSSVLRCYAAAAAAAR